MALYQKILWCNCQMTLLFTFMGGKFKFYAQECDLAPFVGIWTKLKMPFEIKLHLVDLNCISVME